MCKIFYHTGYTRDKDNFFLQTITQPSLKEVIYNLTLNIISIVLFFRKNFFQKKTLIFVSM